MNTLNSVSAGIYKRPKNRSPYRITNYSGKNVNIATYMNKMLSYRRETVLQRAL